jgi:hypothetical protein
MDRHPLAATEGADDPTLGVIPDPEAIAQVDLHPTLILEASQPNLLDPDGGGDALLRAIRASSERLRHLP